jgi:hypothetical protein
MSETVGGAYHGKIQVCIDETDFNAEGTQFEFDADENVFVRSLDENGLFDAAEWRALRDSPWKVLYSNEDGLALVREE